MKNNILSKTNILALSLLVLSGCAAPIENVVPYTPPISATISNDTSGIPLKVKYHLTGDASTFRPVYYHIYNSSDKVLLSESMRGKMNLSDTFGVTNLRIMGTIGDKVVFAWRNGGGDADAYLSVYDFSENRTYHIITKDEKFSILKNANRYIVKNISKNKFISLNDIKEVKVNESNYQVLSLRRYYTGLDNRGRNGRLKTVFTPSYATHTISSAANSYGKLDKLMFGDYPLRRIYR